MYQNRHLRRMPKERRTWLAKRVMHYYRYPNGNRAYSRRDARNLAWNDYRRFFN